MDQLRGEVKAAMQQALLLSHPNNSSTSSNTSTASSQSQQKIVNSLNKTISNQQQRLAVKRSRPVEPDSSSSTSTTSNNNVSSLPLPSTTQSGGNETLSESQSQQTILQEPTKRKKAATAATAASASNHHLIESTPPTNKAEGFIVPRPTTRFTDLAGLDSVEKQITELVCYPLQFPEIYSRLGIHPPSGILLHGPSGCGKTTLASAIAGETGLTFFKVSGPELIGGTSGESEQRIRDVFEAASRAAPSLLFIDALDVIAAKRDSNQRGMDRRIIAQLFDSIDSITQLGRTTPSSTAPTTSTTDRVVSSTEGKDNEAVTTTGNEENRKDEESAKAERHLQNLVVLVVATNKPENIDPGVRGRFAREIGLPVPDAPARAKILSLHCQGMALHEDVNFSVLGKLTPGFVGADLVALGREAGMIAVSRIIHKRQQQPAGEDVTKEEMEVTQEMTMEVVAEIPSTSSSSSSSSLNNGFEDCYVTMEDFLSAAKSIQPSAKREGFATAPDVTWNDVGALQEVREELKHNVLEPIAHPERFRALGLELPAGILFFGPPGCGKTLLAKALANQSGANFISVKGPELLNMYVGESESRVRQVFARARSSAPCMIFFDELDALCPKRSSGWDGGGSSSGNGVTERVVNQLLTELDGLESRKDVYIIGATNRLELIDEAMLRPGRLGNLLYVPLPMPSERESILRALTRKVALKEQSPECEEGVNLTTVAYDSRCDGFSGADLSALVREAGLAVVKEKASVSDLSSSLSTMGGDEPPLLTNSSSQSESGNDEKVYILGRHFEAAFARIRPSVSPEDRKKYELVRQLLKEGLSAIEALRRAFLGE
eukprot:scaffold6852_cov215-Ochromonas_danica.AAC.2